MAALTMIPGQAILADWRTIAAGRAARLDPACRAAVERSAKTVSDIVAAGHAAYGINTGFGKLAQTRIDDDRLGELQRNLLLSHAAGTGALLDDATVHLILVLKAAALARGFSGVRWAVIEALLRLADANIYPCVPQQGSVGASGDLAPLAHVSAALIGVGTMRIGGSIVPAGDALAMAGMAPLTLQPKEGLALINGTQVSTALALRALFAAENAFAAALIGGMLSVDAVKGSDVPFDARIHALRGQQGQIDVAAACRTLIAHSEIRHSHVDCDRVQDPYSLRCQPQVMGACLDQLRYAAGLLEREANGVTDNPLIFADGGDVLSGGNFHAEPVAFAADSMALAIAEIGALAERRIALLTDPALSGLPAFLVKESGINSGFMIAHVTAAALASENKSLAHPASVDSLPTSANQEDHVSMATYAARRLLAMAENTATIAAIELLAAAQGIDFHRPMRSSPPLEAALSLIRAQVPFYERDRFMAPDIEALKQMVTNGAFRRFAAALLPSEAGARGTLGREHDDV